VGLYSLQSAEELAALWVEHPLATLPLAHRVGTPQVELRHSLLEEDGGVEVGTLILHVGKKGGAREVAGVR
jgi:hypothetical protein